jgi:hypothetical protein
MGKLFLVVLFLVVMGLTGIVAVKTNQQYSACMARGRPLYECQAYLKQPGYLVLQEVFG